MFFPDEVFNNILSYFHTFQGVLRDLLPLFYISNTLRSDNHSNSSYRLKGLFVKKLYLRHLT